MYLELFTLATLLVTATSFIDHKQEVHRCRPPPRLFFQNHFNQHIFPLLEDSITRTSRTCNDTSGSVCDLCCNKMCCELVSDSPVGLLLNTTTNNSGNDGYEAWFPIRFILLVPRGNPLHRTLSIFDAQRQLQVINRGFAATQFRFHLHSVSTFEDTRMSASCNTDPCYGNLNCDFFSYTMPKVFRNPEGVVNVVVCDVYFLGEAMLPWVAPESSPLHYVLLRYESLVGKSEPGTGYDKGKTAIHELGHYFGLLHTFGACGGVGDYVEDTSPVGQAASIHSPCTTTTDTCPGDAHTDDVSNYMNYAADECANHFTSGQITRMYRAVNKYRRSLMANRLIFGSCPLATTTNVNLSACICNVEGKMNTTISNSPIRGTVPDLSPLSYCGKQYVVGTSGGPLERVVISDPTVTPNKPDHSLVGGYQLILILAGVGVVGVAIGIGILVGKRRCHEDKMYRSSNNTIPAAVDVVVFDEPAAPGYTI